MRTIHAWTGGSRPKPLAQIDQSERTLVRALFRDQMRVMREYWGDYLGLNRSIWDTARIFWKRARYDAHATIRVEERG